MIITAVVSMYLIFLLGEIWKIIVGAFSACLSFLHDRKSTFVGCPWLNGELWSI